MLQFTPLRRSIAEHTFWEWERKSTGNGIVSGFERHTPNNCSQSIWNLFVYLFFLLCIFLFIEFVGVTLVNKILQVSGAQFYYTSSVYCTVCSPPQVRPPSTTTYPPYPPPPPPTPAVTTVDCVHESFLSVLSPWILPSSLSSTPPSWLSACSLFMSLSLFCLLAHFCSWDSTDGWNHTVLVFLRLKI